MDVDCVVGSWMGCGRVKSFWLKGGLSVLTIGVDGLTQVKLFVDRLGVVGVGL